MQPKPYLNMLQRGFVCKPVFGRKAETAFQEAARPIHRMEAKQICGTMSIGTAYSMGMIAILSRLRSCRTIRIGCSSGHIDRHTMTKLNDLRDESPLHIVPALRYYGASTGSATESKGTETHRGNCHDSTPAPEFCRSLLYLCSQL